MEKSSSSLIMLGLPPDRTQTQIETIRKQRQFKDQKGLMNAIVNGLARQTKSQLRDAENWVRGGQPLENITKTIFWESSDRKDDEIKNLKNSTQSTT